MTLASEGSVDGLLGFFARRWGGHVRFNILFWRDMLVFGSMLNLTLSFIALMFMAKGHDAMAVVLHFAAVPYNLFLYMALWRHPDRTVLANALAAVWLLGMFVF